MHVANLSPSIQDGMLRAIFGHFGKIADIRLVTGGAGGAGSYAFVDFETETGALSPRPSSCDPKKVTVLDAPVVSLQARTRRSRSRALTFKSARRRRLGALSRWCEKRVGETDWCWRGQDRELSVAKPYGDHARVRLDSAMIYVQIGSTGKTKPRDEERRKRTRACALSLSGHGHSRSAQA